LSPRHELETAMSITRMGESTSPRAITSEGHDAPPRDPRRWVRLSDIALKQSVEQIPSLASLPFTTRYIRKRIEYIYKPPTVWATLCTSIRTAYRTIDPAPNSPTRITACACCLLAQAILHARCSAAPQGLVLGPSCSCGTQRACAC
jgi:hypothetical protein